MSNPIEEEAPKTKKRPDLLTVLCILTFIGSGIGFFSNLFVALSYDLIVQMVDNDDLPSMYEMAIENMKMMLSGGVIYFILSFILFLISFIGAIFMWNLKRIGFHLYTIAQILILILPAFFLNGQAISIYNLFFTGLFIALYAINLKEMH